MAASKRLHGSPPNGMHYIHSSSQWGLWRAMRLDYSSFTTGSPAYNTRSAALSVPNDLEPHCNHRFLHGASPQHNFQWFLCVHTAAVVIAVLTCR